MEIYFFYIISFPSMCLFVFLLLIPANKAIVENKPVTKEALKLNTPSIKYSTPSETNELTMKEMKYIKSNLVLVIAVYWPVYKSSPHFSALFDSQQSKTHKL